MSARLLPLVLGSLLWTASLPARDVDPTPEPVRWLQEYLQIDTTNPPGNEAVAVDFLQTILEREGIASRRLESPGGRVSLYARLTSPQSRGEAVVLMHHIDVVPAGEGWRVAPFSGRPYEGKLWGRGALDVKGLGIAQLSVLVGLKRAGTPLRRDVVLLAVADEETGGKEGTGWLVAAHPELFDGVAGVLNEGGSNRTLNDRLLWWGVEVTQKRPLWLRVTATGRGGHASGFHPQSATHRLIAGLAKLLDRPPRYRVSDAARNFLGALAGLEGGRAAALHRRLDRVIQPDGPTEPLAPGLPVYFLDTLQVTEIQNGTGSNVVSPTATAAIDIRLLPDTDGEAFLAELRELLGEDLEVEVVLTAPQAPPSPIDHPLFRTLVETLDVRAPVVPMFLTGTTDSRYFRERGIPAYGFSPFTLNPDDRRGIHARDEAVPRDGLLRGIETLRRVVGVWIAGE